jgi:hypothetical protein
MDKSPPAASPAALACTNPRRLTRLGGMLVLEASPRRLLVMVHPPV